MSEPSLVGARPETSPPPLTRTGNRPGHGRAKPGRNSAACLKNGRFRSEEGRAGGKGVPLADGEAGDADHHDGPTVMRQGGVSARFGNGRETSPERSKRSAPCHEVLV